MYKSAKFIAISLLIKTQSKVIEIIELNLFLKLYKSQKLRVQKNDSKFV